MSKPGQSESEEIVYNDFESLFNSISELFQQAPAGLPECQVPSVGEGPSAGTDSGVLSTRGPSGRPDELLVTSIKQTGLRKTIVRSVIKCATNQGALEVARGIGHSVTKNRHCGAPSFVAVVPHQCSMPHVHVWHDCNPTQYMCRCRLLAPFRNGSESTGLLATTKQFPSYRPLRGVPTEEARKEGNEYFERLLK